MDFRTQRCRWQEIKNAGEAQGSLPFTFLSGQKRFCTRLYDFRVVLDMLGAVSAVFMDSVPPEMLRGCACRNQTQDDIKIQGSGSTLCCTNSFLFQMGFGFAPL